MSRRLAAVFLLVSAAALAVAAWAIASMGWNE